jgi:hypothetical protein
MSLIIPSLILGTLESFNGKVAYSYGPEQTGVPLQSGVYFSGRWGAILNGSQVYLKKLSAQGDYVIPTSTGTPLAIFQGGQLNTLNNDRFNNLAFSFDNSGLPIVAVQDNGDTNSYPTPTPAVKIFWQSGSTFFESGWIGNSPSIFNSVSVNFPQRIPSPRFPTWQTGTTSIFYQKNGDIYFRLLSERFTGEYLSVTGLTGSYNYRTSIDLKEASFNAPYHPFRFSLFNPSQDKTTLRAIVSKSYTDIAFDIFDRYVNNSTSSSQSISGYNLTGGWGNWVSPILLDTSKGLAISFDIWLADAYEHYSLGSISGDLSVISGRYFIQPTAKAFYFPIFMSDSFDNYYQGVLGYSDYSNMTGVYINNFNLYRARIVPSGGLGED